MKKYIVFVLSLLIVIFLTACASETDTAQNNFVEIYKTKATEYIENGDTQAAIDALEDGVEKTGSAELKKMLDELKADDKSAEEKDDTSEDSNSQSETAENKYLAYEGVWSAPDTDMYFDTALTLKITVEDSKMNFTVRYEYLSTNYDYVYRDETIAEISKVVEVAEITDDVLILNYDDDGCGNKGKIKLSFATDFILMESDYFTQDDYFWGFCFDMSKLVRENKG